MAVKTVFVNELTSPQWWFEQLIQLARHRPELVRPTFSRILAEDAELRWTMIVEAYMDHQINLGKAAELLDIHELELRDRFRQLGIPLRLGAANLAEAQAEVEAVRNWFELPPEGRSE